MIIANGQALISLLTAEPYQGKTTVAVNRLRTAQAVYFVPTPNNKNALLSRIPWLYIAELTPERLAALAKRGQPFRVVMSDKDAGQLQAFMGPEWVGWAFVFDDYPQIFLTKPANVLVTSFVAGIRHRDGQIIVTTQRVKGTIPRFVQITADEIIQVGPLIDAEEARVLYGMGGGARYGNFKAFYQAISHAPKYSEFIIKKTE